jgi:hypothetical protein
MTHVYYQPIAVALADGRPATLHWRGITYRVVECNAPWRLMDRWWEQSAGTSVAERAQGAERAAGQPTSRGRSDRTYYRLRCVSAQEDLCCDIYFEAVGGVWILERVYD